MDSQEVRDDPHLAFPITSVGMLFPDLSRPMSSGAHSLISFILGLGIPSVKISYNGEGRVKVF